MLWKNKPQLFMDTPWRVRAYSVIVSPWWIGGTGTD